MTANLKALGFGKSVCWAIFTLIISAVPGQHVPELPIWNFDKLIHGGVYFGLAVILYFDLKKSYGNGFWHRNACPVALICSIAYGGMLELLQASVFINRSGSWLDFFANTLGIVAAGVLMKSVGQRVRAHEVS